MSPFETPFSIEVPEQVLADLRSRIRATRWPEAETVDDRSQGVPLAELRELCEYWADESADGYDWRRAERRLNAFPQFRAEIDGVAVHALHVRSPHPAAVPLVLTHGWPGSVLEFLDVIGPLTDPVAHGGDAADAFHVVVPSLPGYGFSDKPVGPGWNTDRIADAWAQLMTGLGYERFGAQGGDWGAVVTTALGRRHPDRVLGIHVNMPIGSRPADIGELTADDQRALERMAEFRKTGSGYSAEHSTRPQTIGYGLVDSPVALCAWIVEKFDEWTDTKGLPRDAMLDGVTLYWATATGASSARLYWESRVAPSPRTAVEVPAGCSLFPGEILQIARPWAQEVYRDLRYWNHVDAGGHFAAWEQPELFTDEVRAFFRLIRP
jgi:pimeloyl-ACP methyl ester carboxylesterase